MSGCWWCWILVVESWICFCWRSFGGWGEWGVSVLELFLGFGGGCVVVCFLFFLFGCVC